MFYATRIQSVGNGYAVDVQGKSLSFIGDLPVKVGDTVYTDGNIIFGHFAKRGAPAFFYDGGASGIPVLADNLRGYFTLNGVWKDYRIAGENWLTNAKKLYRHDSGNDNVIDAEIARDETDAEIGCYTVEKNISLTPTEDETANDENFYTYKTGSIPHAWLIKDRAEAYVDAEKIVVQAFDLSAVNADYARFDDTVLKECTLAIKKDGSTIQSLQLSQLVEEIEDEVKKYVSIDIPDHDIQDHIKSRAVINSFKILPDGTWDALIFIEAFAERDTRTNAYTEYNGTYDTETKRVYMKDFTYHPSDNPQDIVDQFHAIGWTSLTVDDIKYVSGLANSLYSTFYQATKPWVMLITTTRATTYSIAKDAGEFIYNTTAHCKLLYRISSDGECIKLYENSKFTPLYMTEHSIENYGSSNSTVRKYNTADRFPYVSSIHHPVTMTGTRQVIEIFNLYGVNPMKTFRSGEIVTSPYDSIFYRFDSRELSDAPDYDNGINYAEPEFFFPVQDGYQVKILNYGEQNYWTFGGIFDEDGNQVVGEIFQDYYIAHKDNYSFVPLRGNQFLLGLREKQIFKINANGYATELADNLRNFRLRELNQISKAKK